VYDNAWFDVYLAFVNVSSSANWAENATTVAGQANGTPGQTAEYLYFNGGISISNDVMLYIADIYNNRIVAVQLLGIPVVSTFGSVAGSIRDQFNYSSDVLVTDTAIYVMDSYNFRVQKLLRNGTNPITMPGAGSFGFSNSLFVDKFDYLYVSDYSNSRVIRFAPNSSSYVIVAGTGTVGSAANQLNNPWGIFIDDALTLYITDWHNHRIQKWTYNASSGITVAGTGISGSSLAQLSNPSTVVVDTNGYIYIADSGNNRIVKWAPNSTSGVCVVACTGTSGTQANQLYNPYALAFDSNSSMYVSDAYNNRVQKFQILNYASECPILNDDVETIEDISRPKSNYYANDTKANDIQKFIRYLTEVHDR
jgi:sugar lactone lactonase YvrE